MPSFASFDGVFIFGDSVRMVIPEAQRVAQVNHFFGLSGAELLDGGFRERITSVSGILSGINAAAVADVRDTFRSYVDNIARTLVDTTGAVWPDVVMLEFSPGERIIPDPWLGYILHYTAKLRHLR